MNKTFKPYKNIQLWCFVWQHISINIIWVHRPSNFSLTFSLKPLLNEIDTLDDDKSDCSTVKVELHESSFKLNDGHRIVYVRKYFPSFKMICARALCKSIKHFQRLLPIPIEIINISCIHLRCPLSPCLWINDHRSKTTNWMKLDSRVFFISINNVTQINLFTTC